MENLCEQEIFKLNTVLIVDGNEIEISSFRGRIKFTFEGSVIYEGTPFHDVVLFKKVEVEDGKVKLTYYTNRTIKTKEGNITRPIEQVNFMSFDMFTFKEA